MNPATKQAQKQELDIRDFAMYLGSYVQHTHYARKLLKPVTPSSLVMIEKYWDAKLVLRPLTDLTRKEAFGPDGIFDPADHCPHKILNGEITDGRDLVMKPKFQKVMAAHHFDLFGYIDAGLAVDATQLDNNPYEGV